MALILLTHIVGETCGGDLCRGTLSTPGCLRGCAEMLAQQRHYLLAWEAVMPLSHLSQNVYKQKLDTDLIHFAERVFPGLEISVLSLPKDKTLPASQLVSAFLRISESMRYGIKNLGWMGSLLTLLSDIVQQLVCVYTDKRFCTFWSAW